ncbi:mediator of RNA polymerase II transcription subunit 25-like [Zalophus californianus]|uniref:Mediator of RNA polymerase II transcription subunit 25-like n=1 Tax=Zalophus californianus TaxID=9704 RepID=A0A6J2BY38_ZALCA|nr:mediator of RNA polymerase II transcription subunit 25-like [Zalophus californianus]
MPFLHCTATGQTSPSSSRRTLPRLRSPVPNPKGNRRATQTARGHPHGTHTCTPNPDRARCPRTSPGARSGPPCPGSGLRPPPGEAGRGHRQRPTGERRVAAIPPARKERHKSPPRLRLHSRYAGALPFASLTSLSPKAAAGTRTAHYLGAAILEETALHFPNGDFYPQ